MFKFIHTADLHLDSPLRGLEAREDAPAEKIRGATRLALENIVGVAIDEKIDFMLIAGDIYDGDWEDYSTGLFFRAQMVKLKNKGIPVYLISGNHDAASVISRTLKLPDNVHSFSTDRPESMAIPELPVTLHGRGFSKKAEPGNMVKDYPEAVRGRFNIGLLHTSLNGREGHDTYAPCTVQDLCSKGYDYWALGHIHKEEVVCENPWIVYPGNSQGRHIGETGRRGCRMVTVNKTLRVESVEWWSTDVVRWEDIGVDLTGCVEEQEALDRIGTALGCALQGAEDLLVAARIRLAGSTSLHGSIHKEAEHWEANILAQAQDHGEDALWIEKIRNLTKPTYDLKALASRDPLTKLVIKELEQAGQAAGGGPGTIDEITEMTNKLPLEIRKEVLADWEAGRRKSLVGDVRSIIIEALQTKGGQTL